MSKIVIDYQTVIDIKFNHYFAIYFQGLTLSREINLVNVMWGIIHNVHRYAQCGIQSANLSSYYNGY